MFPYIYHHLPFYSTNICLPSYRLDCLKKIQNDEADFGYFEAEDLKIAATSFNDEYEVAMEVCK